jgi:hypothetical protein
VRRKKEISRSEAARQRRAQRAARELTQTTRRAVKPLTVVSARALFPVKPAPSRRARRFEAAVGVGDIRFLNPPVLRISGWRLASLALFVLFGAALYFVLSLPYFHVPSATVLGNNRLTRDEIQAVTGVLGQSIFTVQPEEVEARLRMNYPELLSAQVEVYLPNHVYITVTEREPVILWQQGEGYTWIDASGVAFRPRGLAEGLIVVKGLGTPPRGSALQSGSFSPQPYIQKELVDAILLLAPYAPPDTTMLFDPAYGLGWKDPRGWKAFFGFSAADMPLKVRVYQSMADWLANRGVSPALINVMYPDAPYYREVEKKEYNLDSGQ